MALNSESGLIHLQRKKSLDEIEEQEVLDSVVTNSKIAIF